MSSQPPPPEGAPLPSPSEPPPPDGPPTPPWQRRRRRWWLIAAVVAGLALLAVPISAAVVAMGRLADDIDLTSAAPEPRPDTGTPALPPDAEIEPPDLADLEGTDAEVGRILVDIDRAERSMIGTQQAFAAALGDPDGGEVDALLEQLSTAAGEGQRQLQAIRRDLTEPLEADEARTVRDAYLAHLDAWVRYLVAVEAEPTLLGGGGDEAFLLAIDTTGDAFARSVREDLPEGLHEDVRAFADAIVERGFRTEVGSDTV